MVKADYVRQQLAAVADPVFLLETLFAEAPIAFSLWHVDGHCLVVNRAFQELFGSVPPSDYSIFKDELVIALGLLPEIRRAFAGAHVVVPAFWYNASKLEHVTVAGRRIAIELSMTPLKDRGGEVRHVVLCYKDVTAERELINERRVQRTVFAVSPEAVVVFDLETERIEDANDNAVQLFGFSLDELRARGPADLSPERQPDGRRSLDVLGEMLARARAGKPIDIDWTHQTATGELVPTRVRVVYLPGDDRSLCRVSIVDLRDRQLVESERKRVRDLQEQNLRIHEANRLKSDFLAAMSHELRTPLNTIIGFSELLFYGRVAPTSPEHDEFLGDILASSRHLLQLVNDVLDLAKVEAGKLEFRPEPVGVAELIAEIASLLRPQSLDKRIRVEIEADPAVDTVTLDPARFRQVLYNYLSNALKFTPEGGSVVIRTSPESDASFRIEVEDNGIGIAPEHLHRLFLEFEQVNPGGSRPQGTGLGLALTRRIVEAQGGTVGVRSTLGHGSVFHAVLPRETAAIPAG